jgi:hypothetical protein
MARCGRRSRALRRFSTVRLGQSFVASAIVSVIALAKDEMGRQPSL